jgi:hypothetical protein
MEINEIITENGEFKEGWSEKIPGFKEAVGDSKYFDTVKDLPGLLKDIAPLAKLKGRAFVPSKDADEDTMKKFASQLPEKVLDYLPGTPDENGDYTFDFSELTPEQRKVAERKGVIDTLQCVLKKAKVPSTIAARVATSYVNEAAEQLKQAEAAKAEFEKKLRENWGDEYDKRIALKEDAANRFLSTDQREALKSLGILDHPVMTEILSEVGARIQPGRVLPGEPVQKPKQDPGKVSIAKAYGLV